MRLWISSRWDELRASFWFVPLLMVAGAVVLSLIAVQLDRATAEQNWVAALGWTFTRGPEGSRAVLSTIAGSMMTTTSVAFSITVVALQLASSQFGPRLLRNFMRDRVNQFALGTFIATFTYCLLVLRTVNGTENEVFVPHLSVTLGLAMALASLAMLIYFFHHAAASIQADNVIASVSRELQHAIDRLFPECLGQEGDGPVATLPSPFEADSDPVRAEEGGYIQALDVDRLIELARDHDAVVRLARRPGKFVAPGDELARVWPAGRVDEEFEGALRAAFYVGSQRSLAQDIEFAIDQLVEVAVRALSPGINDPFTAITCVDRLGEALGSLAGRRLPSPLRYDADGRLRVVAEVSTAPGIVDAAFHQIRQASRGNAAVTFRLLEALAALAGRTDDPEFLNAIGRHAELVHRGSQGGLPEASDRIEADERYRAVVRRIRVESHAEA